LGGVGTIYGLSKWLGSMWLEKQKARYSKELEEFKDGLQKEQKRLQAGIDHSVLVTRAHFETEFAAMKSLFQCLSDIRLRISGVRPTGFSIEPAGEDELSKRKRLFERLGELQVAYNELVKQQEALSPFYPQELFEAADECAKATRMEIHQVQMTPVDPKEIQWYKDGIDNCERFTKAYNRASQVIRERISRLTVLPSI
jgi:hypothetical protein